MAELTRKRTLTTCGYCKKKFKGRNDSSLKFCSAMCNARNKSKIVFERYKENQTIENLYKTDGGIKPGVRRGLMEAAGCKCTICGWNKKHPSREAPSLEIDHIDGNWLNCKIENLRVVCPNCHSLTDTWKGANRGNGRAKRREMYYSEKEMRL